MNARFVTLVAAVSLAALTGCTGIGNGFCGGNLGAPCGAGCAAAVNPAYDYAPTPEPGCGCGTDAYSGYSTGGYYEGMGSYSEPSYQGGWQSSQGVPQPGQYSDGGYVVPNGPGTNMAPAPTLPQPNNQ
ncbi:hypothetical protein CA51_38270 [Rosistilla oblonga]|uniref:Lipoprotein n=1 Tax=Rosistilla oblonga TaxID=2527990 RepID=A0A518IXQ7_9BACT|nr:hypothetical protein [Rosistilla oblonga]QDV13935.1 hypothetical protein CA51_38270 [Rosistilla oblonga]QDV57869.1 hypothetical protein Mal33_38840 [Rosistilla oblonga]